MYDFDPTGRAALVCLPVAYADLPGTRRLCQHCSCVVSFPAAADSRNTASDVHVMCPACSALYHPHMPVSVYGFNETNAVLLGPTKITTTELATWYQHRWS